jgi:dolichol-phosphate mannosyltransferase
MSRPFLALTLTTLLFVGLLGSVWLGQGASNQELLANYAKAQDYANSATSVGGIPWWSPNFMMGGSLAFQSLWALTDLGVFLGSLLAGPFVGPKLAALGFLLLCPFTMYGFVRKLCPDVPWAAFSCSLAYLFSPPLLFRLGAVEHVNMVLSMALMPLAFRGTLVFLENRTPRSALQCAVCGALLVLAYAKPAVLLLPILLVFALWAWGSRAQFSLPRWRLLLLCGTVFAVLAILPNLPTLREMGLTGRFDFGPFEGWQNAFSSRSALSWLDWGGLLSGNQPSAQSVVRTPSTYLGLVAVACVIAVFFLRGRNFWNSQTAMVFRLFVALALIAQWFGFGVHNAVTAQMAFLQGSHGAPDFAIAVSWGLFVLQGVAIFLITPGSLPGRRWWSTAAVLVYFLVPGFLLIEKLPFFSDIRAPHDFFEIGGAFCVAVAAGIAAFIIVTEVSRSLRFLVAAALVVLAAADALGAIPSYYQSKITPKTWEDFLAAQDFLKTSPVPGRVMPFSGRYFYLLTPILSGRPLVTEAFNNYLTLRPVAELQQESLTSQEAHRNYFKVAGISFLLIDQKDPDVPEELKEMLRKLAETAFENSHFLILQFGDSLAPAAFAKNFTLIEDAPEKANDRSLDAASRGLAAISHRSVYGDTEGLIEGSGDDAKATVPIMKLTPEAFDRQSPERIAITPPAEVGWLLVPEAFHPDWQATQNGHPLEIARAFRGLIGIRLNGAPEPVILSFQAPVWFPACLWASFAGWVALGSLLIGDRLGFLPARLRSTLARRPIRIAPISKPQANPAFPRLPVKRFLVIIPTYNEATGLATTLDRTLTVCPEGGEILVIDDGSPDRTADVVRHHEAFGTRIHLLERGGKLGLGTAYRAGFAWALERDFDACIEMDADLSHDPSDIPALLEALKQGADAAIGSRYRDGVRVMNWPQDRLFLSLGASKFVRLMTNLPLTDATSGFKAIRSNALRDLDWDKFKAGGYGFQVELHYFLWKSGANLVEVPIIFTERREGNTKMSTAIAFEAFRRVLELGITGK